MRYVMKAGHARQSERIGDAIEIVPHLQHRVVRRVDDAPDASAHGCPQHDRGEVVGMDVVRIDVVLIHERGLALADARER